MVVGTRERRSIELGIKRKPLHEIRRGSPTAPGGQFSVSVGFLIASIAIAAIFVGALTVALNATGAVRGVAVVRASLSGLYLLSTTLMIVFVQLLVTVFRRGAKRR